MGSNIEGVLRKWTVESLVMCIVENNKKEKVPALLSISGGLFMYLFFLKDENILNTMRNLNKCSKW